MLPSRSPHAVAPAAAHPCAAADRIEPRTPAQLNEARDLHRVFLKLSHRYERHCREYGEVESPAVCAAAVRYREERSLASLVSFVDRLDELHIPVPAGERKLWK